MNSYAKLAIAVTAAVLVAGCQSSGGISTSSGPTGLPPAPTAAPTQAAATDMTAAPSIRQVGNGQLDPGVYAWPWSGPDISIVVPAGWTGTDIGIEKGAIGWGVSHRDSAHPVTHVFTDACHSAGTLKPFDGTLPGLVAALDAQVGTDATVSDVKLAGRSAKRIDLAQAAGLDRTTCDDGAEGPLKVWATPGVHESDFYALAPGFKGSVDALDVDGRLVIFSGAIGPEASASDIAELDAIVQSIRIGP